MKSVIIFCALALSFSAYASFSTPVKCEFTFPENHESVFILQDGQNMTHQLGLYSNGQLDQQMECVPQMGKAEANFRCRTGEKNSAVIMDLFLNKGQGASKAQMVQGTDFNGQELVGTCL